MTDTASNDQVNDVPATDTAGNDKGTVDDDTGIRGISRIPGLKMKKLSLKLTERPYEHQKGCLVCGIELEYLLEFETTVTNDSAANRYDLQKLQSTLLNTQPTIRLKHIFFDEDNAVIPFSPDSRNCHIVGGAEAITGEEGDAFRVLVAYEKMLDPNLRNATIKEVFMGENYTGEHPLEKAKKLVVSVR